MKKFTKIVVLWLLCSRFLYAFDLDDLPDELYVTQHWVSYTTSFDVETKTQKLGTLYRRVLSIPLTYDFYDTSGTLLTMARSHIFSFMAHFDVYDAKQGALGSVDETFLTLFPSFVLYSPEYKKIARADMNFWGTRFDVYDPASDKLIAVLSRPFFRIKNDWVMKFIDRDLFKANHINVELFLTVVAFQADREYWEQQQNSNRQAMTAPKTEVSDHQSEAVMIDRWRQNITTQIREANLGEVRLMDDANLEVLANRLSLDYERQRGHQADSSDMKNDFVDYCLGLTQSNEVSLEEKKAILYLLQQRLGLKQ